MWINFNFHNFWQWASNCKWISTLHNNMNDAYLQIETVVMFSLINEAQITNALPIPIIVRIFTKKDRKNYTYTSSSETFPAFCPILLTLPSFAAPRSVACNGIKTVNFIHIERSRTWERERERLGFHEVYGEGIGAAENITEDSHDSLGILAH